MAMQFMTVALDDRKDHDEIVGDLLNEGWEYCSSHVTVVGEVVQYTTFLKRSVDGRLELRKEQDLIWSFKVYEKLEQVEKLLSDNQR